MVSSEHASFEIKPEIGKALIGDNRILDSYNRMDVGADDENKMKSESD